MDQRMDEPAASGVKNHRKLIITLCIVAAAVVAAYLVVGIYFRTHFQPNTVICGIACDYMTPDELEMALQSEVSHYELVITERGGETETIDGSDIGIRTAYGSGLTEILQEQRPFLWPGSFFRKSEEDYDPGRVVEWNEEKFRDVVTGLNCMDTSRMLSPQDAEILYSEEEEQYYIKPAEPGTYVRENAVISAISDAVFSLSGTLDLEEAGCYQVPSETETSPSMIADCDTLNQMIAADITYDMLDIDSITISKSQIRDWITTDESGEFVYDEEAVAAFVAEFAEQYDTLGKEHSLYTSWGFTTTVSAGTYGWKLNQDGELAQLMADLEAGEEVFREPVWSNTAVSHGANDYGSTYVEINLTKQHLYFYKNGSLIIDSDFVSGKMTNNRVTHEGIYYVYLKRTDAVLKGEDYETPVSYWMPFHGGEGMHDATWRGSFGGNIYMYNGSHGCINLPYSVAKTIYENISVGDCVFVYWENGLTMELQADPATTKETVILDDGESEEDAAAEEAARQAEEEAAQKAAEEEEKKAAEEAEKKAAEEAEKKAAEEAAQKKAAEEEAKKAAEEEAKKAAEEEAARKAAEEEAKKAENPTGDDDP